MDEINLRIIVVDPFNPINGKSSIIAILSEIIENYNTIDNKQNIGNIKSDILFITSDVLYIMGVDGLYGLRALHLGEFIDNFMKKIKLDWRPKILAGPMSNYYKYNKEQKEYIDKNGNKGFIINKDNQIKIDISKHKYAKFKNWINILEKYCEKYTEVNIIGLSSMNVLGELVKSKSNIIRKIICITQLGGNIPDEDSQISYNLLITRPILMNLILEMYCKYYNNKLWFIADSTCKLILNITDKYTLNNFIKNKLILFIDNFDNVSLECEIIRHMSLTLDGYSNYYKYSRFCSYNVKYDSSTNYFKLVDEYYININQSDHELSNINLNSIFDIYYYFF